MSLTRRPLPAENEASREAEAAGPAIANLHRLDEPKTTPKRSSTETEGL